MPRSPECSEHACGCVDHEVGPSLRCPKHAAENTRRRIRAIGDAAKHSCLRELEQLARRYSGTFSLVVDCAHGTPTTTVTFKRPGQARERVVGREYAFGQEAPWAEGLLTELLNRLGVYKVQTTASLVDRMSDAQRARVRQLIDEILKIKYSVLQNEPVGLQSGLSRRNLQHVDSLDYDEADRG